MTELENIVKPLCEWYQENKRDLPWRKDVDPYRVWVSEIMLQQTRVEAVKEYFERFLKRLPTIYDLATIEEDALLKLWEGLGYYNRVKNMQKMAKIVCQTYHGQIPNRYEEIIRLPGIGPYTAGAILSIAYHLPYPCIDGNVLRVITRITGNTKPINKDTTKKEMTAQIQAILPKDPSIFNQALMELGALICIPNGKPNCSHCPVQKMCVACMQNRYDEIPVKEKKRSRKIENKTVFLISYQDRMKIEKRKSQGLLSSLYQFPNTEGHLTIEEGKDYLKQQGYDHFKITKGKMYTHIFTHLEWNMISYNVEVEKIKPEEDHFVLKKDLENIYSLPSAFKKFL